jgi:hypothetical protein
MSGDQIGAAPRVIGGAFWGRIGGLVAGVVNAVVEWWSGKDIGDHVYAAVFGDPKKGDSATAVAQGDASPVDRAPNSVASGTASVPTTGEASSVTAVESPAAAAQQSDAVVSVAPRSELPRILASSARIALSSYERNLRHSESEESHGVRLPA